MSRGTIVVLLGLSACATAPAAPEPEYKPTGEVVIYERTSTFDGTHVRGPSCNLSRRDDGSWGGVLGGRGIDVAVTNDSIRGVDLTISREESTRGHQVITALFMGLIYRFELSADGAIIRTPTRSMTFPGRVVGERLASYGGGVGGAHGDFTLRGDASLENPPWPQLALALLATYQ
jgi:hypothetical protein